MGILNAQGSLDEKAILHIETGQISEMRYEG
jgi:hypothetical protein